MINNLRDLGGIKAQDGRILKRGVFARSALLNNVTPQDRDMLYNDMGIRLVVDLRTDSETYKRPNSEIPGIAYFHVPMIKENDENPDTPSMSEIKKRIASSAPDDEKIALIPDMGKLYINMLRNAFSKTNYLTLLKELTEFKGGGVLYHCTSGKDRTGMVTAGLLIMLGAGREAIMEDYMKSRESSIIESEHMYSKIKNMGGSDKLAAAVANFSIVRECFMEGFLTEIEAQCGSLEKFGEALVGLSGEDLKRFRNRVLE
jgi:protein-tyrosine phosphatase